MRPMVHGLYGQLGHSIVRLVWHFHDHDLCITLDGWEELALSDDIKIWWVDCGLNITRYYNGCETRGRRVDMCRIPEIISLFKAWPDLFYFAFYALWRCNRLCRCQWWWVITYHRAKVGFIMNFALRNWHRVEIGIAECAVDWTLTLWGHGWWRKVRSCDCYTFFWISDARPATCSLLSSERHV